MLAEYAKLLVLAALLLLVAYSSVMKYYKIQQSSMVSIRTLTADYDLYCSKQSSDTSKYNSCKSALDKAITEATVSCKGYLEKEASCFSISSRTRCAGATAAVDGCLSMIATTDLASAGFS